MNFTEFMLQNVNKIENIKYVVSDRFTDNDGKPMEWEIRCLDRLEEEEIMKTCYKKNNSKGLELDELLFAGKLMANSVVYPNLNNAMLQNSYGVMSADTLLKKMLIPYEYLCLQVQVQRLNSNQISIKETVEAAKK